MKKDDDKERYSGEIIGVEPDIKPREIKWERPKFFAPRALLVYFIMIVFWIIFMFYWGD